MEMNLHQPLQYVQIKKKKKAFQCKLCKKEYQTEPNLKKHMVLCEILHQSANNNTSIINPTHLYQIIQELVIKQKRMEEKIEELQKWVEIKKKKINIIDWLNNNRHPNITFKHLIDLITVQENDIDFLYKPDNSVIELILLLFERDIYDQSILPIFALNQKNNNLIYYYDISNVQNELTTTELMNTWRELNKEKLTSLLNQIHSKILNRLMVWKKKHHEFILSNDKNQILYCKMMNKFMSIDFKQPLVINRIYSSIYNKIKGTYGFPIPI